MAAVLQNPVAEPLVRVDQAELERQSVDLSARLGLQKPLDVPMLSATVALPLPGVPKQKRSSDALALELHP